MLTRGYYGLPAETARAFTEDGWLHTGDLVTVDPGGLYTFVARKKEVLRRRGENLSPAEVEEVLEAHPDVLECAVVGVASELSEEEVKAFVVPVAGRGPDFADLRAHTAARLAAFKVPRYWQLIDECRARPRPGWPGTGSPEDTRRVSTTRRKLDSALLESRLRRVRKYSCGAGPWGIHPDRPPAQSARMSMPAANGTVFSYWDDITRCQVGCVICSRAGRLVAVRSPRNEAGERLAR